MTLEEALIEIERLDIQLESVVTVLNARFETEGQEITQEEDDYLSEFDPHLVNRVIYPWCKTCAGVQSA